jgi:galactokinase/mevalonate kinase-like predicted kinase
MPVPGDSDSLIPTTLFDRQIPVYRALPGEEDSHGQVVIASGDVLIDFDPMEIEFTAGSLVGLATYTDPDFASRHGVFCLAENGRVKRFLQKPTRAEQLKWGASDRYERTPLDIGVFSLPPGFVRLLLELFGIGSGDPSLRWTGLLGQVAETFGIDFYREVCCAIGTETNVDDYVENVISAGSRLPREALTAIYERLSSVPFRAHMLQRCRFLHFGTLGQLISSGTELLNRDRSLLHQLPVLNANNRIDPPGRLDGSAAWVEGCRVKAPMRLAGHNVVVGVDVDLPLEVPRGMCLDVVRLRRAKGWIVRIFGIGDSFNTSLEQGAAFCNQPLSEWLAAAEVTETDVWPEDIAPENRRLWNACLFPGLNNAEAWVDWAWMLQPQSASKEQWQHWRESKRYSCEQALELADSSAFHGWRRENRMLAVEETPLLFLRPGSDFSASELRFLFESLPAERRVHLAGRILSLAFEEFGKDRSTGFGPLELSRILHSLGSALEGSGPGFGKVLGETLDDQVTSWLQGLDLDPNSDKRHFDEAVKEASFRNLGQTIIRGKTPVAECPRNQLRSDEIIWGRAPARLDLGGGWTDTPPYSLEQGGCVLNVAVDLNGQPPIHVYARVSQDRCIKITSIDHGLSVTIAELDQLLDYGMGGFGLAKAALVLSGFSPRTADWPEGVNTLENMLEYFGGGIELTTLAAIPSGSGLGTSSIMGAVLLAVLARIKGGTLGKRELFHRVLQLEQELTTGGGWQDQIGGCVDGLKLITTNPGLYPDPVIQYVPGELLDPGSNSGLTLLYYTGVRRLAKNILQEVVARYMDRDRLAMASLRQLHVLPPLEADLLSRRDLPQFGGLVDRAWELNKRLDPKSTTGEIERLFDLIRPHVHGAKLLGAGGGGFLFLVCRSGRDAERVSEILTRNPPNERARFFDYSISRSGLEVTVC